MFMVVKLLMVVDCDVVVGVVVVGGEVFDVVGWA